MAKKMILLRALPSILALVLVFTSLSPSIYSSTVKADEQKKDRVIVSMGDSYSSGEGIEEFYYQDLDFKEKTKQDDWLAHRSKNAWPGQLGLRDVGLMRNNKDGDDLYSTHWFFVASSGAVTDDLYSNQIKKYSNGFHSGEKALPPQLEILNDLANCDIYPDYVTLTLGGNDADFAGVIISAVLNSYITPGILHLQLLKIWLEFWMPGGIRAKLKNAYKQINEATQEKSCIIVAGYPHLLDDKGRGTLFSESEAEKINENITMFNDEIEALVNECHAEGMNIHFVSVEESFYGHEAYTDDPFINPVITVPRKQDINQLSPVSAYSMHPNLKGARAYAECVQKKINELEGEVFYPDPADLGTYYLSRSFGAKDYFVSDYTLANDGTFGSFSLATINSYSQDYVDSLKAGDATPSFQYSRDGTIIDSPYAEAITEKTKEYKGECVSIKPSYRYFRCQGDGKYYYFSSPYHEKAVAVSPVSDSNDGTELAISPHVEVIEKVDAFSPYGIHVGSYWNGYENADIHTLFFKNIFEFVGILKGNSILYQPDLLISVEKNRETGKDEITRIIVDPCHRKDWRKVEYCLISNYSVSQYSISGTVYSCDESFNDYIDYYIGDFMHTESGHVYYHYTRAEIESLKVGDPFPYGGKPDITITKIEEWPDWDMFYIESSIGAHGILYLVSPDCYYITCDVGNIPSTPLGETSYPFSTNNIYEIVDRVETDGVYAPALHCPFKYSDDNSYDLTKGTELLVEIQDGEITCIIVNPTGNGVNVS